MAQRIRLEVVFDTTDHNPDNVIERIRKELRLLLGDSLVEVERMEEVRLYVDSTTGNAGTEIRALVERTEEK